MNQYEVYLGSWILFCSKMNIDQLQRNDVLALEFLRKLLKQGTVIVPLTRLNLHYPSFLMTLLLVHLLL